ncbi:MAG: EFR1 family ferrodoxin [Promethearchaeota archaeon]
MIPIYFFSASGNTKYCVELVKRGFNDKNISIELLRIESIRNFPYPNPDSNYPAIGLAFPVYEFMVPRIILIWLKFLPKAKEITPVFIIDTSGGFPCNTAEVAMNLLKMKNYDPLGILEVPTPTAEPFFSNVIEPVGWDREILARCYFFGSLLANRLKNEEKKFIDLRLAKFRFSRLTNFAYRYISRGFSFTEGLIKYNESKCNKCGTCEEVCPMAAIDMNNIPHPIKHNRCMFCAICIRSCPTHALTVSYRSKGIPPSPNVAPKLRPGYIDPQKFHPSNFTKFTKSYFRLMLRMMRVKKQQREANISNQA